MQKPIKGSLEKKNKPEDILANVETKKEFVALLNAITGNNSQKLTAIEELFKVLINEILKLRKKINNV